MRLVKTVSFAISWDSGDTFEGVHLSDGKLLITNRAIFHNML